MRIDNVCSGPSGAFRQNAGSTMALPWPARRVAFVTLSLVGLLSRPAETRADEPTALPEVRVTGDRAADLEVVLPRREVRPPAPNVTRELLDVPGIYGQTRGTDALEPSIRGLGFDRVTTTYNGLPLVNASPERTHAPLVVIGAAAVADVIVLKSLPSVTLGPVTTGGVIAVTGEGFDSAADPRHSGFATLTYDAGRDGTLARVQADGRSGPLAVRAAAFHDQLGDYTAADGRTVPARLEDHGASVALGWQTDRRQTRAEFLYRRLVRQDVVSLPLDGRNTETQLFTLNDAWPGPAGSRLQSIAWRFGYSKTEPYITNEDRNSPTPTSARATASSGSLGLLAQWQPHEKAVLTLGADHSWQRRRAVRTTPAGVDYIWPGVAAETTGVFAEWSGTLTPSLRLRAGTRLDQVRSDARDVDQAALGRRIREQFVTYNGPDAARISRHEIVSAENGCLLWSPDSATIVYVGAGVSTQPAQATERYRALLNALGGDGAGGNAVELGNPALAAERKIALEAGVDWQHPWLDLSLASYGYRIDDFVVRTPVGHTAPPLPPMLVFGYRNIDATFYGVETSATLKIGNTWQVPVSFATAKGRNDTSGRGLTELPPWEARAAVRYHGDIHGVRLTVDGGGRCAAARTNPAPQENPLFSATGGFVVWHVRGAAVVTQWITLAAGVENLLDRRYSEYLTPPAGPFQRSGSNLRPGDRIPGSGRSVWASLTLDW